MKRKLLTISLIIISFSTIIQAQNSYIQVVADPGISVFINGKFQGITSSDFGGLIIKDLSGGTHTIKVVKEGFTPQESKIILKAGEVKVYTVQPFSPRVKIRQKGSQEGQTIELKTGDLKIQSIPVGISIKLQGVGGYSKTDDEWYADELPIGKYNAKFFWNDKTLGELITIYENMQTELFVNMINDTVEFRGKVARVEKDEDWIRKEKKEEAERIQKAEEEARIKRESEELERRRSDIFNRTRDAINEAEDTGTEGISYYLAGRQAMSLPKPKYDIQEEGIVVVEITVDRNGNVTKATAGVRGSTTLEEYFLRVAREAAMTAKFDRKPDAPLIQKGTITYHFILR